MTEEQFCKKGVSCRRLRLCDIVSRSSRNQFTMVFISHRVSEAPRNERRGMPSLLRWGLALVMLSGCGGSQSPLPAGGQGGNLATGPTISADPNPVPAPTSGKFGKTTVTWNTGNGSVGEVYVVHNGQSEKRFAGNRSKGALEAPWIGNGVYEFRLYAGKDHKDLLAKVEVTQEGK
jgi:hypothetical protein